MHVESVRTNSPLANYNYFVVCEQTGEALVIDPFDGESVLSLADARGWQIRKIVNTHEHWDHIGGNEAIKARTGATVFAHAGAAGKIPSMDAGLAAGDVLAIGTSAELLVLDTPGHTSAHVCLRARGDVDALFSGDTMFNAGVGNCKHGGDPHVLFATFRDQIAKLPDSTLLYPGHDYVRRNLAFSLSVEPDNAEARRLLAELGSEETAHVFVATLGLERKVNAFLRLDAPSVHRGLRDKGLRDELGTDEAVFVALRRLRDGW